MTATRPSVPSAGAQRPAPWSPSYTPSRRAGVRLYIAIGLVLFLAAAAVVTLSLLKHASVARERRARTAVIAKGPLVQVASVVLSPGSRTISLTGETRPFLSVALYAKVSGYLKSVRVDKGDHVKEGEVLAVIQSPETDQRVEGAIDDFRNKRTIAERDAKLIAQKLIAPEEAQTAETDAQVAAATVQRFEAMKDYEVVRAPFNGTVTARYADPGALVQDATSSQTAALPVVEVGTTDSLRVFVFVDQRDAADIHRGAPVTITDPTRPSLYVSGSVTRYTGQLDQNTRTLLAEIDISNREETIVPGSFVQVHIDIKGPRDLEIPEQALIIRGAKDYVAVVSRDDRVSFRPVQVLSANGVTVRLASGVQEGERVALNLGESVANGQHVQPIVGSSGADTGNASGVS